LRCNQFKNFEFNGKFQLDKSTSKIHEIETESNGNKYNILNKLNSSNTFIENNSVNFNNKHLNKNYQTPNKKLKSCIRNINSNSDKYKKDARHTNKSMTHVTFNNNISKNQDYLIFRKEKSVKEDEENFLRNKDLNDTSNFYINEYRDNNILNTNNTKIVTKSAEINNYFNIDIDNNNINNKNNHTIKMNHSCDNFQFEYSEKNTLNHKVKEKMFSIEKKIYESFEYIKKEIISNKSPFLLKFKFLNEKIENINKITSEKKNLKGEIIHVNKLNFLLEIFDIYGINHYYTSMSIEMVNYYYNTMKKMFLNFIKILNNSIITINSLENTIINIHECIKQDFEDSYNLKLPKMDFDNYFSEKLQSQKFFHSFYIKIYNVKELKFKPVFAYYNITNLIGILISLIFFIRAISKLFKFQPNQQKIIRFLIYSISSIFLTYILSFILNRIYNRKSEKKFIKLTEKVSNNLSFIINYLNNMEKTLEEYRVKYKSSSLNFLNKIKDKM